MTPPKPGSEEARKMGCVCPPAYNQGKVWHVSAECDLHRIPALDVLLKACGVDGGGK